MNAGDIITDAYERLNRLSPGETITADDLAFGLRRLNSLVDEMSASRPFLYLDTLTSVAQTGHITLGTGPWSAIPVATKIISMTSDGVPMTRITMEQYNSIYSPTTTGAPQMWAFDGVATVKLYQVATGQTLTAQTQSGVASFADTTTEYTAGSGYKNALAAGTAVRCAPALIGSVPQELLLAQKKAFGTIGTYEPKILDVFGYKRPTVRSNILTGW